MIKSGMKYYRSVDGQRTESINNRVSKSFLEKLDAILEHLEAKQTKNAGYSRIKTRTDALHAVVTDFVNRYRIEVKKSDTDQDTQ